MFLSLYILFRVTSSSVQQFSADCLSSNSQIAPDNNKFNVYCPNINGTISRTRSLHTCLLLDKKDAQKMRIKQVNYFTFRKSNANGNDLSCFISQFYQALCNTFLKRAICLQKKIQDIKPQIEQKKRVQSIVSYIFVSTYHKRKKHQNRKLCELISQIFVVNKKTNNKSNLSFLCSINLFKIHFSKMLHA